MDKAGYIRIIEIDEAIYQLKLILEQPDLCVTGATFRYITNQINSLQTEKQNIL